MHYFEQVNYSIRPLFYKYMNITINIDTFKEMKEISSLIEKFIQEYLIDFQIQLISDSTILTALDLQTRYLLSYWDALIVATALEANCTLLITEDMQNGLVIDKTLAIKNPFSVTT